MSPARHRAATHLRTVALLVLGTAAAGCGEAASPTAPLPDAVGAAPTGAALAGDVAALAAPVTPSAPTVDGISLARLPAELQLTAAQRTRIDALLRAFEAATRADAEALAALSRQADAARRAGRSAAEVRAILEQGTAARQRLEAASRTLQGELKAVLTAEQRAWVEAQAKRPRPCDPRTVPPLTAEQAAQIRALQERSAAATRADADALARIMAELLAARQAGRPEAELRAIVATATPIRERLSAAERQLRTQIEAVLTPAQKASGCPVGIPPLAPPAPRPG